ncbi:MAG TPA: BON domain-containing protein [Opitutus sp.]|nr:BON domain-containing protein [Opitutus sp.]
MKYPKLLATVLLATAPLLLLAESATDQKIEDAAKSSYNFRAVLDNQVHAKAENGVVTLTGTVQDRDQKALAEDTVRSLPGVERVDNQVEVASTGAKSSDGWIALKVRSALLVHANVSMANTDVTVHDGVATLTGTAESEAQKELTTAYVKGIDGVTDVKNELQVRSGTMAANSEAGESSANSSSFGGKVDDASITAQVKYELLTHHSTSALHTSVDTRDGVVRIHGVAKSDAEKDLVTKLAGGIKGVTSVKNDMTVQAAE